MAPMTSTKRSCPDNVSPAESKTVLKIPNSDSSERSSKRVCRLSPPTNRGGSTLVSNLKIAVVCSSNQNRSMEAHNLLKKRGFRVQSFGTGSCVKLPGPTVDKPNIYSFDTPYQDQFVDLKRKDSAFYTQNGLLNMLDRNRRIKEKPERFQENQDEFDLIVTCQERVFDQVLERGSTLVSNLKIAVVCSSNQNRSMEAHNLLKKRGFRVQSFGTGSCVKLPGPTVDKPNIYSFDTPYQDQFVDLKRKDSAFYTQNGLLNMLDRNRRIKEKPERFQENQDEFDLIVTCQERVFDQVLENMSERGGNSCKMVHVINVEIKDNHDDATLGAFVIHELVKEICSSDDPESDLEEIIDTMETKKKKRFLYSPAFY